MQANPVGGLATEAAETLRHLADAIHSISCPSVIRSERHQTISVQAERPMEEGVVAERYIMIWAYSHPACDDFSEVPLLLQ